jgi:type IV secretory pathway VirD2 relaxase
MQSRAEEAAMADDYVDENGRIRWIERHEALAPVPVRDERDEDRDDEDDDDRLRISIRVALEPPASARRSPPAR